MEPNSPLDSVGIETTTSYELAPSWKRFVTFIIDYIIVIIVTVIVMLAGNFEGEGPIYLLLYGTMIIYYLFFEYMFGRTPGKFIMGTVVVREDNLQKISISQGLGRTISRFVPFEPFSFLGSNRGWHDTWSSTMVVNASTLVRGD